MSAPKPVAVIVGDEDPVFLAEVLTRLHGMRALFARYLAVVPLSLRLLFTVLFGPFAAGIGGLVRERRTQEARTYLLR